MKDFEKLHIPNWPYLPLATVDTLAPLKTQFNIKDDSSSAFLEAYRSCDGDYKKLRTVTSADDNSTWDIVRNKKLGELLKKIDNDNVDLWADDLPSQSHTELIIWAYSPDASKIKKQLSTLQEKLGKSKSDDEEDEDESKNGKDKTKKNKRKSGENEPQEEDDSPKKKKKE